MVTFHIEILFGADLWAVPFTMASFIAVVADHIIFRICNIRTFVWNMPNFATIIAGYFARTVLNRKVMSLFGRRFLYPGFYLVMHYVSYLSKMSRLITFKARLIIFGRLGLLNIIFWVSWFYLHLIFFICIFAWFLQMPKSSRNTFNYLLWGQATRSPCSCPNSTKSNDFNV